MSELTFGQCPNCDDQEGTTHTQDAGNLGGELAPLAPNELRAKPADELLQLDFFVEMALWLRSLDIDVPIGLRNDKQPFSLPMVRWMVAYALYGGMEKGITYTKACGCPLEIEPESIDEVFDGRKTERLPVNGDWNKEPVSYDRGIRFWVERAVAGAIKEPPGPRWLGRLTLLELSRQVLSSDLFQDA